MSKIKTLKFQSTELMKKIMDDYYKDLKEAGESGEEKIAWCTSAGPSEFLRSFGFKVYFPENHTAILGSSRIANDVIPIANSAGFSPDICSYLTSDVGAYLAGITPLKQMYGLDSVPKPDVLVYNTNQCRDVQDWFGYYAKKLDVPLVGINSPTFLPEVTNTQIDYVSSQFKDMIPTLEKVSDRKFDNNKLKSILAIARDTSILWEDILKSAEHIPSPLSFFDACIQMGPIVVLRGENVVLEYYKQLKAELDQRIENNVGAVEEENVRIYWDGMPIWGKLRSLSNHFAENNANVVASTYCNSWAFSDIDPNDPFKSMAKIYTELFINRDDRFKLKYLTRMIAEFKIDGVIYHDSKTCPNNSNNRYQLPQKLQEIVDIPFISINGDQNDLRCFSEEQSKTNIEAFIEQISANKELLTV